MSATTSFIVTGGAGFIGSNLVKALNERGHTDIIVVDHLNHPGKQRNLDRLVYKSFYDKTAFRSMLRDGKVPSVSGVFHMGACSSTLETDESYLTDNNFQYSVDLCQWSLKTGARFVYASSAATYGDGANGYVDDESATAILKPLNAYGRSKQMFDMWVIQNDLITKIVGLKYFNVYGPGEDHKLAMRSLVNKAYAQVKSEGMIRLFRSHRPDYRDGEQKRDFVYVEDAVAETLFFFDHPDISGLFNCGSGQARTWLDLARALFAAMLISPKIEFVDIPENIRANYQYHTQADLTKLRRAGYAASFLSIEDGVRRYITEYLNRPELHTVS
jgi:ADP-L-glycero-D-manno-heptose 6-epimerase